MKLSSKRWISRTSAPSGRVRATTLTIGSVTAETRRLTPTGPGRDAQRSPGQRLDQARERADVGPAELLEEPVRRLGQAEAERRADVAIPRPEEHFAEALPLAFGRHHDVHAPRSAHLPPSDRHLHGHRRVLSDDCRAFARNPDLGLAARVVRIAQVLPVPAQPAGLGGVVSEHTTIERVDDAPSSAR